MDEQLTELRCVVGEGPSEATLRGLLARTSGDVAAAANAFFDGSTAEQVMSDSAAGACHSRPGDDVLATLFKTLEDVGRKLAERDQQLDLATRVCETLVRRVEVAERTVASCDADQCEREEAAAKDEAEAAAAAALSSAQAEADTTSTASASGRLPAGFGRLHHILRAITALPLMPASRLLRWVGGMIRSPLLLNYTWPLVPLTSGTEPASSTPARGAEAAATNPRPVEMESEAMDEEEYEHEGEEEDDEEMDGEEEEEDEDEEDETLVKESEDVAQMAATVAAVQAQARQALSLPAELLEHVTAWEAQQAGLELEWRQRQSRLHAEFEERKRRLEEQQIGQRKKFREACNEALRPLYEEGAEVCAELEKLLVGKICRICQAAADTAVLPEVQRGPLARIKAISFGKMDSPLRIPNCPSRGMASVPVSAGVLVTLEKIVDRNGIAMLPASDDPMAPFTRSGRGTTEMKIPLRLLSSRVRMLTEEETALAVGAASGTNESIFIVRYSGGENGAPIEPVEIKPAGLSLAEYEISFASGVTALRVEHRADGPVKCRAEPAAQKQVFSETPVELYTEEVDNETHNIVQLYFSDLRDEVAVDVLNLTNSELTLQDTECVVFQQDATGAALNYKIIVRDGAVIAVLYQEGDEVHSSPFVEHRLPPPGSYVTLPDGSLGKLQALPRGLIVACNPRDLPENAPQFPLRSGLRAKGKHPAELPGVVDIEILQQDGAVLWPPHQCSIPVCALRKADSARLQAWHAQWDSYVTGRGKGAHALVERMEQVLEEGLNGSGRMPKEIVSQLTELYGELEEIQRELHDLKQPGVAEEQVNNLQRRIQRFAALARFG